MVKNVKKLLLQGKFLEAEPAISTFNETELSNTLFEIGNEQESLCAYSFICFLLMRQESISRHNIAFNLLIIAYPHIKGSYESALYHARRIMELCPEDVEYGEYLLILNKLPGGPVTDEEAKEIALKIYAQNPSNLPAQEVIFGTKAVLMRLENEKKSNS
jgi:tetratricopeptide (TPR) repeat protein